jgi:ATP-binding cassette subfamily F protein 3
MSLLTATDIEKHFGADTILDGVSLRLGWRQRLGLVGRNGSGKTTMLRILTGQLESDKGHVRYAPGVRFGYLRQEQVVDPNRTVYQEAEDAFAPVLRMEQRLRELELEIGASRGDALTDVLDEYGLLRERFEAMGGYDNLRDIGQVLKRLGFAEGDQQKAASKLSGGEKTRLALAKLLLSSPDVLFLDEPTNHLDIQATEWLEGFLQGFGGAVMVVSHDRVFLDNVVETVAEIHDAKLTLYSGNYSTYAKLRDERMTREREEYRRTMAEIARLEEFWRRNKAGQLRNMAWARFKAAERLRNNLMEPTRDEASARLAFAAASRSGDDVLVVDRLKQSYGERTLFENLTLSLRRGDRLGVAGPNGAGKSTFIRCILGREMPTSGSVHIGVGVTVGYFAQDTGDLDPELSVLDTIMSVSDLDTAQARNWLARFLFTGDEVFRPVKSLSGGEKNKLVLAQIALARPNLMILDEPTNHLDIDSREALTEMLRSYDGTVILVSHDRYLLEQATSITLEIADGRAVVFDGTYGELRAKRQKGALPPPTSSRNGGIEPAPAPSATTGMTSYQLSKERQKSTKEVARTEARIAELEDLLARIEEALSQPMPGDDAVQLSEKYQSAQNELESAMEQWERAVLRAQELGVAV